MRKILFILCFFKSFVCLSQFQGSSNLVEIEIIGNNHADEGSTEVYLIKFAVNSQLPSGQTPNFVPQITKGVYVSFAPSQILQNAYDLVVKWDCKPDGNGSIKMLETVTSSTASLNVELSSFTNALNNGSLSWFCNSISNSYQNLVFGDIPNPLGVTCTRWCTQEYNFQYQWQ